MDLTATQRRSAPRLALAAALAASGSLATTGSLTAQVGARACVDGGAAFLDAVRAVHEEQRNVAFQAAVALDGQIVVSAAEGFADLEHGVAATPGTRFGIASITKAFTGVALAMLVSEGAVDLDAPVQRYVPEYPSQPAGVITPRLLAIHTAGIPHPRGAERVGGLYDRHFDDPIAAIEVYRDVELAFAPGTRYVYSSSHYNLLAAIIQRVSGVQFQEFVTSRILEPLGLERTVFDDVRWVIPDRARRYSFSHPVTYEVADELHRVPGSWDYSFNMGGGNMLSTAEELVRFGSALIGPGLLSAETLRLLHETQATGGTESPWSLGWFVGEDPTGGRRIRMTGANPGLQAGLVVYPEHGLAVAVLSNAWGIGARSAEMVNVSRFAAACMGWPAP